MLGMHACMYVPGSFSQRQQFGVRSEEMRDKQYNRIYQPTYRAPMHIYTYIHTYH